MEPIGNILKRTQPSVSGPVSAVPFSYRCQVCHDVGFVHPTVNGKPDYGQVVACECTKEELARQRAQALMKMCHLPAQTESMTLKSFDPGKSASLKQGLDAALQLAEEIGEIKWLTLMGGVDRGKTHLAVGICRRWLARGRPAYYGFVPLLLKELRDGFELEGEESYRRRFDFLCRVPLLVLDDLAVERPSDWAREQVQTIIHYRGINALPLVVTSNKPLDAMGPDPRHPEYSIDPEHRIASRLQRETWCKVVVIDGPEHRLGR